MNRHGATAKRPVCLLGYLLTCLVGCCVVWPVARATAQPVPVAAPAVAAPLRPIYQAQQGRFAEAVTKARLYAKLAELAVNGTPNMELYDVLHYDLDLDLDPTSEILTGTVVVTVAVTTGPLSQLDLDLRDNLTVSAVFAGGTGTTSTHSNHVLTVDLDRAYATGEIVTVSVTYAGNPASSYFGWDWYDGDPWIWTLSEPYGARRWWPCKDLNTDKPDSVDIRVTVPDGLIVASNGLLVAEVDNGATRTFHWHESYPIATYLVSLAIHPFATFSHWYKYTPTDSMEVQYYVLPDRLADAQSGYAQTVPMLEAFAAGFGEYPFVAEKYGHAHFNWGGGMEHQTLTSLGPGAYSQFIISHELAHQWWGDLITCADFHHIWLNEGFATWSEAYWREQNEGMVAYHEEMAGALYWGPGTIYVEDPSSFGDIFDWNLSYQKASWVVHMLRHVLGDTDFFAALAAYSSTYGHGSATTEQFRDICETVSGLDLDAFFQQWIHTEYYPQYVYGWYDFDEGDSTRVQLVIEQQQTNTGLFTMPLDVTITTDSGAFDFVVQNSQALETYSLMVTGLVQNVELDRDFWVLATSTEVTLDAGDELARRPVLLPNHPNPFNPTTTIEFKVTTPGFVSLEIFDVRGRRVRTLIRENRETGWHEAVWDGRDDSGGHLAAGTYFYRLRQPDFESTRKMSLVK